MSEAGEVMIAVEIGEAGVSKVLLAGAEPDLRHESVNLYLGLEDAIEDFRRAVEARLQPARGTTAGHLV